MPKRLLTFFLLLNLIFPWPAFAQENATPSAVFDVATSSATLAPEPSPELLPLLLPDQNQNTAQIKQNTVIRNLSKSSYSSKDKISLVVSSGKAQDTQIKIFNPDGVEVSALLETIHQENPAVITLTMPAQFKSGRYRIVITATDGTTSTQDFLWGVLAINPDQSLYTPNSIANFSLAVLDETGLMVCDADLTLQIKTPTGTTDSPEIKVSPVCSTKDFTLEPDYSASYQLTSIGTYQLTLTAVTKNGTYSIKDSVEVVDHPDYIIKRTSATRIFPPKEYPMLLDITFNASYSGQIVESVPAVFAIGPNAKSTPYDQIELATSSATTRVLNIPELHLPFDGVFPISQTFGSQPDDQLLAQKYEAYGVVGHDGTDFAVPIGTPVITIDDGIVVSADVNGTYGQTIVIEHSWGKSYYGHLSQITTTVGSKHLKGHPIGISGNSGLSTGPHLHLSVKPNNSDPDNGYYGKVNPLPYLGTIVTENGLTYTTGLPGDSNSVTRLIWNINAQAGDKLSLGYNYQVPNFSPQFYLVGPLQIGSYQEPRQWQLAIDADGSGTATVTPNIGEPGPGSADYIYTFTYTATETMDSGGISITVPSSGATNWSAPQGVSGTAGYTTVTTTATATTANVLDNADSETPASGVWQENDQDMCGSATTLNGAADIVVDTTNKQEGTGSIQCASAGSASDTSDSWGFIYNANQNWATACAGGACTQIAFWVRPAVAGTTGRAEFAWSGTTDVQAGRIAACTLPALSDTTWTYVKCNLSGTLTTVRSFGFICIGSGNTCSPFEDGVVNIDYVLAGPGSPTFAGSGPWDITVRFLNMASTETAVVQYGNSAANSGVTNSSTDSTHIFTTKSRTTSAGTLTNISNSPWITITRGNSYLMRHGKWFNSSDIIQPFAF